MRPATFEYVRATTLEEAVQALEAADANAEVLAGGQVLVNRMRARLEAEEFLANGPPRQALAAGEILVEVRFGPAATASAFEKLSRRAADPPIVNAAAAVSVEADRISAVGLALVGVHQLPVRARPVEQQLAGHA